MVAKAGSLIAGGQIIEAVFDPTVKLHHWYRENLTAHHGFGKPRKVEETEPQGIATCERPPPDGLAQNSITIESMARIPELIHAPRTNFLEIQALYLRACLDTEEVVKRQLVLTEMVSAGKQGSSTPKSVDQAGKLILLCQVARSMLLSIAIVCNAILAALDPSDLSLSTDCARFCDDAIALAHEVSCYRPLGASHVPLCLIGAYMAVADAERQQALHGLLLEYGSDFPSANWLDLAENARHAYLQARQAALDAYQPDCMPEVDMMLHGKDESLCNVQ